MKKSEEKRLQNRMNQGRAIYFESFKKLYEPIIKKLNHNGVHDPTDFNKKYMLRSSLNGNYVPLMDVKKDIKRAIKNNYIPKSKLSDYIKKYEAKHNENESDNQNQNGSSNQNNQDNNDENIPDDDSKLNDSDGNDVNNYPE